MSKTMKETDFSTLDFSCPSLLTGIRKIEQKDTDYQVFIYQEDRFCSPELVFQVLYLGQQMNRLDISCSWCSHIQRHRSKIPLKGNKKGTLYYG